MADDGVISFKAAKMKQQIGFGRKVLVKSLLDLSVVETVANITSLLHEVKYLPASLKSCILHLMSKRSNLITDENLHMLATEWTKELDFTSTSISDSGLLKISPLPYLYKLDLNDTRTGTRDNVTSRSLCHVAKSCPNLRIVYLRRCINVCDEGVSAIAENCKLLLELNLSGCVKITDESIRVISEQSRHLTNLNLAYTSVTDQSTLYLAQGVCASKLQEVQISHCRSMTDEGVETLLHGATNVTYLEIQGCPQVTDRSITALDEMREKFDLKQFNFTIPI